MRTYEFHVYNGRLFGEDQERIITIDADDLKAAEVLLKQRFNQNFYTFNLIA